MLFIESTTSLEETAKIILHRHTQKNKTNKQKNSSIVLMSLPNITKALVYWSTGAVILQGRMACGNLVEAHILKGN